MYSSLYAFIKPRQSPSSVDRSDNATFLETLVHRLNEIMHSLIQEKQQFELEVEFKIAQLHMHYADLLQEKEQLISRLDLRLKQLEEQSSKVEKQLKQDLDLRDQSVLLLKNILKKKIISEVAMSRQGLPGDESKKSNSKDIGRHTVESQPNDFTQTSESQESSLSRQRGLRLKASGKTSSSSVGSESAWSRNSKGRFGHTAQQDSRERP